MLTSSPRRPSATAGRLLAFAAILLLLLPLLAPLSPGEATPPAASAAPPAAAQAQPLTAPPTAPDRARVEAGLRSSPVMFIENVGQFDEGARFQVRGATGTMWLAQEAVWIAVVERSTLSPSPSPWEGEGSLTTPSPAPPRHGEGSLPPPWEGEGVGG